MLFKKKTINILMKIFRLLPYQFMSTFMYMYKFSCSTFKIVVIFCFLQIFQIFQESTEDLQKSKYNISLNILSINSHIITFISRHTELCNMPTLVRKTVSLLALKAFIYVQQYMMSTGDARSS